MCAQGQVTGTQYGKETGTQPERGSRKYARGGIFLAFITRNCHAYEAYSRIQSVRRYMCILLESCTLCTTSAWWSLSHNITCHATLPSHTRIHSQHTNMSQLLLFTHPPHCAILVYPQKRCPLHRCHERTCRGGEPTYMSMQIHWSIVPQASIDLAQQEVAKQPAALVLLLLHC